MSDSLQTHGLQHVRPPCPSSTPRAYSNSCPLSQWCHPTISSSVIPFSSRLLSFPTSASFLMRIKQVINLSHHRCINKYQFPPTDLQILPRWVDFSWSRVGVFFKKCFCTCPQHKDFRQGLNVGCEGGCALQCHKTQRKWLKEQQKRMVPKVKKAVSTNHKCKNKECVHLFIHLFTCSFNKGSWASTLHQTVSRVGK